MTGGSARSRVARRRAEPDPVLEQVRRPLAVENVVLGDVEVRVDLAQDAAELHARSRRTYAGRGPARVPDFVEQLIRQALG